MVACGTPEMEQPSQWHGHGQGVWEQEGLRKRGLGWDGLKQTYTVVGRKATGWLFP